MQMGGIVSMFHMYNKIYLVLEVIILILVYSFVSLQKNESF